MIIIISISIWIHLFITAGNESDATKPNQDQSGANEEDGMDRLSDSGVDDDSNAAEEDFIPLKSS